jgi:hypothetical protein
LTAFEPESLGNLVEGMDFHKFYFENGKSKYWFCFKLISKNVAQILQIGNEKLKNVNGRISSFLYFCFEEYIIIVDNNGFLPFMFVDNNRLCNNCAKLFSLLCVFNEELPGGVLGFYVVLLMAYFSIHTCIKITGNFPSRAFSFQ